MADRILETLAYHPQRSVVHQYTRLDDTLISNACVWKLTTTLFYRHASAERSTILDLDLVRCNDTVWSSSAYRSRCAYPYSTKAAEQEVKPELSLLCDGMRHMVFALLDPRTPLTIPNCCKSSGASTVKCCAAEVQKEESKGTPVLLQGMLQTAVKAAFSNVRKMLERTTAFTTVLSRQTNVRRKYWVLGTGSIGQWPIRR